MLGTSGGGVWWSSVGEVTQLLNTSLQTHMAPALFMLPQPAFPYLENRNNNPHLAYFVVMRIL